MVFYRIRKPSQKLSTAPIVGEDDLVSKCKELNEECHGIYPSYELYKYENKNLTNVYEVRVVTPNNFDNCSLPSLMREQKI